METCQETDLKYMAPGVDCMVLGARFTNQPNQAVDSPVPEG